MSGAIPLRCAGVFRRHRRPGLQEDLSGAAGDDRGDGSSIMPIIGVAEPAGRVRQFRARARDSIVKQPRRRRAGVRRAVCAAAICRRRLRRPATFYQAEAGARAAPAAAALPGDPTEHVCRGGRGSGQGGLRRGRARGRREALRPRPRVRAGTRPHAARGISRRSAIFRIDHFLGKEAVRTCCISASPIRFSSRSGTATMSQRADHHGRELRRARVAARFYDEVGAIRDVVQNHLLQMIALLAMEPRSVSAAAPCATRSCACSRRCGRSSPSDWCAASIAAIATSRAWRRTPTSRPSRAAPVHRFLALGRRAVLYARRQMPADHHDRSDGRAEAAAAGVLRRRSRRRALELLALPAEPRRR